MEHQWPSDSQRLTVIGKTGSGKTQGSAWQLAARSYTTKPWLVFDFKYDDLLNQIPGAKEYTLGDKLPKKPGLYLTHPRPGEEDKVESLLWTIWEHKFLLKTELWKTSYLISTHPLKRYLFYHRIAG